MTQRHMPMGYRMVNGQIQVQQEQAEIVRDIFKDYVSGKSMLAIAKELTGKGVLNANWKPSWNHGSIGIILQNVKYQGDEFYPRLIDAETFKEAQKRRKAVEGELGRTQQLIAMKNKKYFFGKIRCGECGEIYKKYIEHAGKPSEKVKWKCKKYISQNRVLCRNLFFNEDEIKNIFIDAANQLIRQKWLLDKSYTKEPPKMTLALRQTENRIKELEENDQFSSPVLAELIFKRAELYYNGSKVDDYKRNTERIKEAIAGITNLTEFDEELFESLIKSMRVYKAFYIEVEFINGIIITLNLEYKRKDGKNGSSKKDGSIYTASDSI